MKGRRLVMLIAIFGVVAVALSVAFAYRYLLLSKLNVTTGDSEAALGLRRLVDIPLAGGATRFDYQSIDPQRGLLFIAHLGDGQVIVFDVKQQRVVATIPGVAGVHGVLA